METGDPMNDTVESITTNGFLTTGQQEHRRLLRRLLHRTGGPGPRWLTTGDEYLFFGGLSTMTRTPAVEVMIRENL